MPGLCRVSQRWVFQSLPGQPLESKKYNGYFSALFPYRCLSDGKLKVPVLGFDHYLRNKKVIFIGATSMQPDLQGHSSGPEVQEPQDFSLQEQKCKMQCQAPELVMVWALMSLGTSWFSISPSP